MNEACISGDSIADAAYKGNMDMVKYLVGIGEPINKRAITSASKNGHIHIIKFLIKFIKTFEKIMQFTIQETASRGHFEIIKI